MFKYIYNISLFLLIKIKNIFFYPSASLRIFIFDLINIIKIKKNYEDRFIFVSGYPKSGTTWIENFISNLPYYSPRNLFGSKEIIKKHELPYNAFDFIPKWSLSSIKTHINPSNNNINILLNNKITKLVILYRDPRDIIVSNYYYLKKFPIAEHNYIHTLDKYDALNLTIKYFGNDFKDWITNWKKINNDKNIKLKFLFLKYEDFLSDQNKSFKKILDFYNIDIKKKTLTKLIYKTNNISKNFGKSLNKFPGNKSTFRSGNKKSWVNELSIDQKLLIKDILGEVLIDLGYEKNLDW